MLLYDAANNTIGLKPTSPQMHNAYPALKSGRHGGLRINAYRLLTEHALLVNETLEFPDAEIDEDGILIVNLRAAKSPTARCTILPGTTKMFNCVLSREVRTFYYGSPCRCVQKKYIL